MGIIDGIYLFLIGLLVFDFGWINYVDVIVCMYMKVMVKEVRMYGGVFVEVRFVNMLEYVC